MLGSTKWCNREIATVGQHNTPIVENCNITHGLRLCTPAYEPCCASHKLLREIARIVSEESALEDLLCFPDPQTVTPIHANGCRHISRLIAARGRYA